MNSGLELRIPHTGHDTVMESLLAPGDDGQGRIEPTVAICFMNWSGSNYLADLLRATGAFDGFREILNDDAVTKFDPHARAVGTMAGYLRARRVESADDRQWGFKASGGQLLSLYRGGVIPAVLSPRVIEMVRRDKVAQGISLYVARRTGRWADVPAEDVDYDGQGILDAIQGVVYGEAFNRLALTVLGLPVLTVTYEDLLAERDTTLERIAAFVGVDRLRPDPSLLVRRRQSNEVTDSLRRHFEADLSSLTISWA